MHRELFTMIEYFHLGHVKESLQTKFPISMHLTSYSQTLKAHLQKYLVADFNFQNFYGI